MMKTVIVKNILPILILVIMTLMYMKLLKTMVVKVNRNVRKK